MVASVFILGVLIWNYTLARQIRLRKDKEAELLHEKNRQRF